MKTIPVDHQDCIDILLQGAKAWYPVSSEGTIVETDITQTPGQSYSVSWFKQPENTVKTEVVEYMYSDNKESLFTHIDNFNAYGNVSLVNENELRYISDKRSVGWVEEFLNKWRETIDN